MAAHNYTDPVANLKPGDVYVINGHDWSWAYVVFKSIPYASGYQAASDGRILSCWNKVGPAKGRAGVWGMTNQWRTLTGGLDKDGYRKIILCANGHRFYRRIHLLILETFIGPCPTGMVGCHNNGKLYINSIWNLRWDTQAANMADKGKHGTRQCGERNGTSRLTETQVKEMRQRWRDGGVKQAQLAEEYGLSIPGVSAIVTGRNWKFL